MLVERAGTRTSGGSITGFYNVLVEGDDMDEPIADASRAILDGHIVLSRELAIRNHYPAIDILNSLSRVMPQVVSPEHLSLAARLRAVLATHRDAEDLINIGAYQRGSNPKIDEAMTLLDPLTSFLRQRQDARTNPAETLEGLRQIFAGR